LGIKKTAALDNGAALDFHERSLPIYRKETSFISDDNLTIIMNPID